ncbi:MAG: cytoskeletal protein CcmA (bactofilin family) [Bacteroidia bacterium]|jgi:cytoskeletal protein CcmA (bactofilin family)
MFCPRQKTVATKMFERSKNKPDPASSQEPVTPPSPPVPAKTESARSNAMIGSSIHIKGEVTGEEDLLIQGTVEGTIHLGENEVSIGESGTISADIQARSIRIDGEVTGDIKGSEKVVISRSGNVRGNIIAPRVTLEDGAIFKGSIDMDPGGAASEKVGLVSQQSANSPATDTEAPGLDFKSG